MYELFTATFNEVFTDVVQPTYDGECEGLGLCWPEPAVDADADANFVAPEDDGTEETSGTSDGNNGEKAKPGSAAAHARRDAKDKALQAEADINDLGIDLSGKDTHPVSFMASNNPAKKAANTSQPAEASGSVDKAGAESSEKKKEKSTAVSTTPGPSATPRSGQS